MKMNLDMMHVVLVVLLCVNLFFVVKLDRKLSVCPKTGDIPCKCNNN